MKQCYHRLEVDWGKIEQIIDEKLPHENRSIGQNLNWALKSIHEQYHAKIEKFLKGTIFKKVVENTPIGLPIGLPSSSILANWELMNLDAMITNRLRPTYYGRYVDDLLLVLNVPKLGNKTQDATSFFEQLFVDTKIIEERPEDQDDNKNESVYRICGYSHLLVQSSKTIIHYYQHDHSWAGLKEFKEEIKKRTSEFRFLPTEEEYKNLDNEAYDLQYDGSIYKLRSLIGITENHNKLTQYIYKQQLKAWLCSKQLADTTIRDLFLFYKGTNILNYVRTWEKIFTLFAVTDKKDAFDCFEWIIKQTIDKIVYYSTPSENENFEVIDVFFESISEKLR